MRNVVFRKSYGKCETTEARINYLVQEPNLIIQQNFFPENLLAIEMKITQVFMNKRDYLGLLILGISQIVMESFSMTT